MTEQERRQKEETNYYLVLELDFRKPEVSKVIIEKAFQEKRKEWSKYVNNPVRGRAARQNLELTGKSGSFAGIMLADDPNGPERKEEAEAAKKIAEDKVESIINNFSGIGEINTSAIKRLLDKYKKYQITMEEFRSRMEKNGIEEIADTAQTDNAKGGSLAQIQKDLDVIGKKTLYDYLFAFVSDAQNKITKPDGSQWTLEDIFSLSSEQMSEISDKAYKKFNSSAKKDEKTSVNKNLASACKTNLIDARKRQEYDAYINSGLPEEVGERIDSFGIMGTISLEQAKDLIKLYASLQPGLPVETITERLRSEFINRKIYNFEFPYNTKEQPVFRRCNICGRLSDIKHTHCAFCGKPFMILCFNCGAEIENGINNCPRCGTDLKAKADAEDACSDAQKCLDHFDFAAAEEKTELARRIWPNCPLIAPLERKILEKRSQMEESIEKISELVRSRYFLEAKSEYEKLAARIPGYRDDTLLRKIDSGIAEANEWLRKAKAALGDEARLIDCCSKALALCADLQEARMLVLKYPPRPASNIKIKANQDFNLITWDKSPSSGSILYRLVRKEGSVPGSDSDGQILTETSAGQFQDWDLKANVPMYYSVYTYRSGISAVPLANREAVYNYIDVEAFEMSESDACINLSWKLKDGINAVEVYRKADTPPAGYGDGEKLNIISGENYSDLKLQNDRAYFYSIYAVYHTAYGTVHSPGRTIKGTPAKPPEKVSECVLLKEGNTYSLEWKPAEKGNVEILMAEKMWEDAVPGSALDASVIRHYLQPLPITMKSANKIKFEWKKEGVIYLYPINFVNQIGVTGDCIRISSVADFTNLQEPKISGNRIYLFFDWSCRADSAVIVYKVGACPTGPEDMAAKKIIVTREQYLRDKNITIYNVEKSDYYFTVYAVYEGGVYSSGISTSYLNGEPVIISYSVQLERNLLRRIKGIKVTVQGTHTEGLPRMLLFKKNGIQPVNKGDGILVSMIENTDRNSVEISIPDTAITEHTKFNLFFEDDGLYSRIQLRKR